MRKQFVISATALIITSGLALAQHETPQQYDKSSAPSGLQSTTPDKSPVVTLPEANTSAPETTGEAANFDDRWSAQSETPARLPTATMPGADAPGTAGQPQKSPLDQGNGNWDPPSVTAPSTQRWSSVDDLVGLGPSRPGYRPSGDRRGNEFEFGQGLRGIAAWLRSISIMKYQSIGCRGARLWSAIAPRHLARRARGAYSIPEAEFRQLIG